jgi:hypothetical protein
MFFNPVSILTANSKVPGGVPAKQHRDRFDEETKVFLEKYDLCAFVGRIGFLPAVRNAQVMFLVRGLFNVEIILFPLVAKHLCVNDVGEFWFFLFHFSSFCFGKVAGWQWHIPG